MLDRGALTRLPVQMGVPPSDPIDEHRETMLADLTKIADGHYPPCAERVPNHLSPSDGGNGTRSADGDNERLVGTIIDNEIVRLSSAALEQLLSLRARSWDAGDVTNLYFIQAGGSGGPIKIGRAKNVGGRLAELQCANHEELVVLATRPALPYREWELHLRFASTRIRGEWFEPDERLLKLIEETAEGWPL